MKPIDTPANRELNRLYLESNDFKEMLKIHQLIIEEFTCYDCSEVGWCSYAYDPYNINGDCLALK